MVIENRLNYQQITVLDKMDVNDQYIINSCTVRLVSIKVQFKTKQLTKKGKITLLWIGVGRSKCFLSLYLFPQNCFEKSQQILLITNKCINTFTAGAVPYTSRRRNRLLHIHHSSLVDYTAQCASSIQAVQWRYFTLVGYFFGVQ